MICKAKNKAELQAKLNAGCVIEEPTPRGTIQHHSGDGLLMMSGLPIGFREPVCLDPDTRRRFAVIEKTANGWKVK